MILLDNSIIKNYIDVLFFLALADANDRAGARGADYINHLGVRTFIILPPLQQITSSKILEYYNRVL